MGQNYNVFQMPWHLLHHIIDQFDIEMLYYQLAGMQIIQNTIFNGINETQN